MDTKVWLEKHVDNPLEITKLLLKAFQEDDVEKLHQYLQFQGMFRGGKKSEEDFNKMIERSLWTEAEKIYQKYKSQWDGVDIPIYLFPIKGGSLFFRGQRKSGIAFNDKMILFISPNVEIKELEALMVHEYHHVNRLKKMTKPAKELTLMDSLIMEGLAEYTVNQLLGEQYTANWTTIYEESEIIKLWKKYIEENLTITKKEKKHESIMYGKNGFPPLLGYCIGYHLVKEYYSLHRYSTKTSFSMSSDIFRNTYKNNLTKP
ncbi:DUF2268 domain-containing protein [Peribacillus alkalitolerans]|uniref:DUF2268 domain-containing protein n=1 Tax=Peribacillus alkalitolerans TaxID=1550385 RepID=UPI0013D30EBA|nr:DUF2268 domain-containing putative Zn-dependent protease [Peribacillus alkalitolerans]